MGNTLRKTMDYQSMIDMFERSGLEIHQGDTDPEGLLTCFELLKEESGERIGAASLCCVNGNYILRSLAVEECCRGKGYGKQLVDTVLAEAEKHHAPCIWLTAKVPMFYSKFGFRTVPMEEAPFETKCRTCPQYHCGCEAEVMVLDRKAKENYLK